MENTSNKWLQHAILLSAPLLSVIDVFIVNIAIPSIQSDLGASNAEIELIIAAYLVGYASFMITGSRAGDFWGRKKVFLYGMLSFVVTSCICGMAQNATLLVAARFFQGVSGAFMTPQALSYVQLLFPDAGERTRAIGWVGITLGIASLSGQFLGGYFSGIQSFIAGWRFIFFINLPIGLLAMWATRKYLMDTRTNTAGRFDWGGVVLLVTSLSCMVFPLTEGREFGWPLWSIVLLIAGILLFTLFVVHQYRRTGQEREVLVDNRLFKTRSFNLGLLMATFYFMMHTSYYLVSTIYIQKGLHTSPYDTGILYVYSGMLFMLSSLFSIKLVNRFGKRPVQYGIILMALTLLLQSIYINTGISHAFLTVLLALNGLAGGLVLPSLINFALKSIPAPLTGGASGVYNTNQQIASSFGICLIAGLFFHLLSEGQDITMAFHAALYIQLACMVIVWILSVFYKPNMQKV